MKWTPKTIAIAAGALVLGVWYLKKQAGDTVKDAANAVNPTNPDNVFYEGVNSVGSAVSGDEHWSLGSWIYELTHEEVYDE